MHIAEVQCQWENAAARTANRVLICDTNAVATAIWHHRYMGCRAPAVDAVAAAHRCPDLYLLTDVDTPFVDDGTRDGEAFRTWMHGEFERELQALGIPFYSLSGPQDKRKEEALGQIARLMRHASL